MPEMATKDPGDTPENTADYPYDGSKNTTNQSYNASDYSKKNRNAENKGKHKKYGYQCSRGHCKSIWRQAHEFGATQRKSLRNLEIALKSTFVRLLDWLQCS